MKPAWMLALWLFGCAGGQKTNGLCFLASAPDTPETWRTLLLYDYDPKTKQVARPVMDCMGTPLFSQPLDADRCSEDTRPAQMLPAEPLTDADVTVSDQPDGKKLVWVRARKLVNGEAVGPVALVEPSGRGWSVRAIGTLQSLAQKAQLRLETGGGTRLLVAEAENCEGKKGGPCARTVRLIPLRGSRFMPEPLSFGSGECVGSAVFHIYRLESVAQVSGWKREYELSSTLTFNPQAVQVHEQLLVSDRDPRQGDSPPRVVRRAQSDRNVRVDGRRLVVDGDSLWSRVFPPTAGR